METFIKNCTGIILAGGENTRMPVLKAFIEVEGRKIIDRNLRIINNLFRKVFIVTNQPDAYSYLEVPMLGDIYNTRGPMIGILTALLNSQNPWVHISACDMPFINVALITYMASKRDKFDAVVPKYSTPLNSSLAKRGHRGVEPLFAFYSKSLLGPMEESVLTGKKSMKDFLRGKRVKYITTKEIRKIDPGASSFVNLNSPDDVDLHLQTKDKITFKRKMERRGKCLV